MLALLKTLFANKTNTILTICIGIIFLSLVMWFFALV